MATTFLRRHRDISAELTKLIEATKGRPRGAFIPHSEIEEISGIHRTESALWSRLIRHWKTHILSESGIWIEVAIPVGTGYRFLMETEQLHQNPVRLEKQAMRRMRKAAACLGAIPLDALSEQDQRFQRARLDQMAAVHSLKKTQIAEVSGWVANPQTLPKMPPRAITKAAHG